MRKLSAVAAATLTVVLLALALVGGRTSETSAQTALDPEEQAFLTLLNNYRTANGATPLLIDPSLQAASEWMSADMAANSYMSHTDSTGRDAFTRMCNFGYCYNGRGENIAAGFSSAQSVFNAWKASSGHNTNMLRSTFRVTGIARALGGSSGSTGYWTNDFGSVIVGGSPPPAPSATPTPTPTPQPATPTPVPTPYCPNDADCDGYANSLESYLGTSSNRSCAVTTAANDESVDSWPPDLNDDRYVNAVDVFSYVGKINIFAGQPGFSKRLDLNRDSKVTVLDLFVLMPSMYTYCP